jgi:hypothetical protein
MADKGARALSTRVSIFCPHCHQRTSIEPARIPVSRAGGLSGSVDAAWQKNRNSKWWIGACNYCTGVVLVLNSGEKVYPHPLPSPTDENVPEDIRGDLDEAKLCFSVSAWRGAAVMARRAMQSAAIEKGATKKKQLGDQIAELAAQSKITGDLEEWATAVRWVGNDAAHPGKDTVSQEDAEAVVKLAEQFLHSLYVAPAIARNLRAKKGK